LEVLNYKDKIVPSVGEDRWKSAVTKKGEPVFERQNVSDQKIQNIVQFFASNYVPPPPKKEG
jgi:hypothetical protein